MNIDARAPRGAASDPLMLQIDGSNVLGVRNRLQLQAEQMQRILHRATLECRVTPCGQDLVSLDAAASFDRKIRHILQAHTDHLNKINEAVHRLTEAARQYGYTDSAIAESLAAARPGPSGTGGSP
ncbi:hypothetical protein [Pseudonocardia sp. NPDC046786]|uniref:hypothetical protein n=1 Tax=Pseudonocardia sp. NPDC046786 TaxID=3155471 RepID=UPI0033CB9AB9